MLRELLELWSHKEPLKELGDKFGEMLRLGRRMFDLVTETLFTGENLEAIRDELYGMDRKINGLEQEVRRLVYTKLLGKREENIAPCLILFSVVKDAERCGDYGKNIYEVFVATREFEKDCFYTTLQEMRARISFFFSEAEAIFRGSDTAKAREFLVKTHETAEACERHISEIVEGAPCARPAAFALLFRFFKRIACHLMNIISSVVMPIDRLDYFDEDHRDEMRGRLVNGEPQALSSSG